MRISECLGEGRDRASCASAGVWGGQGPSIMRISGCLGRAGAEHHAHQRVSGELQIQCNPSPTKLDFVGLAKNKSTGGRRGGGGCLASNSDTH